MLVELLFTLAFPAAAAAPSADPRPPAKPPPAAPAAGPERPRGAYDEDERLDALGIDGKEPLPRFAEVAPGILRSGQPNRAGLAQLAARGVKTVLSLRKWRTSGERAEVTRLKMTSLSVPMTGFDYPSFGHTDQALALLADPARRPILVHCAYGKDRTGSVVAAYRVLYEGKEPKAAAAEAKGFGCCPGAWSGDLEGWLERYRRYRRGRPPGPPSPGPHALDEALGFELPPRAREAELGVSAPEGLFDGAAARGGGGEPVAAPRPRRERPSPTTAPALAAPSRGRRRSQPPDAPGAPRLTPGERADLLRRARRTLETNAQSFETARGTVRFTAPDRDHYPYQWLWDSAFHSIGLRHVDPARAQDELRSLLSGQWDNGMIPNMVNARPDILWRRHRRSAWEALKGGRPLEALREAKKTLGFWVQAPLLKLMHHPATYSSGITQPPVVAEAAAAVGEKLEAGERRRFLEEVYPGLRRYYDWIARERVQDGLMVVYHSWETGTDNSPRFDPVYGQKPGRYHEALYNLFKKLPAIRALKKNGWRSSDRFAAKSTDMNSYYHHNLLALAGIARELGKDAEAAELDGRAAAVKDAIRAQLWDAEAGGFRDLGLIGGRWRRLPAATALDFIPLYAGILDAGDPRLDSLVGQLLDPKKFWTQYPVPSVSREEPSFDPKAYWRGTSWVNVNFFLIRGLLRYGYKAEARELIEKSLAMVKRGGMREYFNPDTAEGYRAKDLSWTAALVLELDDMLKRLDAAP